MELKMKYHYNHFIYPYVVKKRNYRGYINALMKNSKCTPKYFEINKDLSIYNYFLPTVRNFMFKTFDFSKKTTDKVNSLDDTLRGNVFKSSPCAIFEYNIGDDTQAKTGEEDGIFFRIQKIEIICFKTGICFLTFKTNIEDSDRFSDLLNFNIKFRDINSEADGISSYGNIKLQSSTFGDIKKLSELIREITGSTEYSKKIDVNINRFLIYSYVCIDQEYWNESKPFAGIEKEFFKFANILNSEFNSIFYNMRLKITNLGNYIKVGTTKAGVTFLTSSVNTVNYTNLPFEFENEYFYTYIFALYEKFYFSKILNDFKSEIKAKKAIRDFANFTNDIWVHDITNNDNGSLLFDDIKEALELSKVYENVKKQYDVVYKNFKVRNSDGLNRLVLILLIASIVTNIVNFINLYKLK